MKYLKVIFNLLCLEKLEISIEIKYWIIIRLSFEHVLGYGDYWFNRNLIKVNVSEKTDYIRMQNQFYGPDILTKKFGETENLMLNYWCQIINQ